MNNIIKKFNLEEKVKNFVHEEVGKLVAQNQHFNFTGQCKFCGNKDPHIPHATGKYSTVRFGTLETFCLGVEGDEFHIGHKTIRGGPEYPTVSSGFWYAIWC